MIYFIKYRYWEDEVISIDVIDIPTEEDIHEDIIKNGWHLNTDMVEKIINFYIRNLDDFGGSKLNSDFKISVLRAIRDKKLENVLEIT
jgi:hypothetical protein